MEIAIALIVCGTALVLAPPASDYLRNEQSVRLLEKSGANQVQVGTPMSEEYRIACWFTGAGMIAVAVIASIAAGRRRQEPAPMPGYPGSPVPPGSPGA
jgi:hypothetical protein